MLSEIDKNTNLLKVHLFTIFVFHMFESIKPVSLPYLGVFIHIFLWISPIPLVWYCQSDLRKVVQMSSSIGNSRHPSALMVIFRPFLAIFLTTTFISFTKLPIAWRKNCLSTQNSFLLWNCLSCLPENRKYIHIRKLVKLSNYLLTMY